MRQLFHIKQTGSVVDYVEEYAQLVDQLAAYTSTTDPLYYTLRFIDGLREDIKSIVLVQRPPDLDTACVLAALPEEVGDSSRRRDFKRSESGYLTKSTSKNPLPLPTPPVRDKQGYSLLADDRRGTESSRTSSLETKAAALRSYRRAMGLCYKCNERWSREHKCAPTVQLHAVQELWELFQLEDEGNGYPTSQCSEPPTDLLLLAVSKAAVTGFQAPRTVKLVGSIQNKVISILVDSGSTSSFISSTVAAQLTDVTPLPSPSSVQVAGGGILCCSFVIKNVVWVVSGYSFQSELRVLPLAAYDVIIGMDWLEQHSPMKVHWKDKWMEIPYHGQTIVLRGEAPPPADQVLLQICFTTDDGPIESNISLLPTEIQSLVSQFSSLFEEPSSLPPSRPCDHEIPLIPGARPVNVRPYRYPPALKDEIEKQIAEMLAKGLIQHSSSLFSSPVLLVKKKDGSYRFCVDFRHLNALTLKSKYPVPIFNQLMDELAGASWFTSLDLRSGFHQIRLKPGEEFKIAFQTHSGHYEFRVVAFGLTGAPGSFQGAMDDTLAPGLRKFVIVFFDDILIYSKSYEDHLAHIRLVFEWLAKDQWFVKLSKCKFAQRSVYYLGHIISQEGIATDPSKVYVVVNWPVPSSAKELRSFLGLAGY
jgi:hypothetical protein